MKTNTCAVFFSFLFVILSQTGNFLFSQTPDSSSVGGRGGGSVIIQADTTVSADTGKTKKTKVRKIHAPRVPWKAALMSGCLPGLGQIYNRKYWKLPIVWGALGTTGYFLVDQHIKFIDARDAYRSLVNDTISLPGYESYANNPGALKSLRDNYERTRNILCIVAAALWVLNIVDATVDAHLSTFDVGPDLSMKVQPVTFYSGFNAQPCVGLNLSLNFK